MPNHDHHEPTEPPQGGGDLGFSLLEIIFIILIAGILSGIVVYSVSGMTASAAESTCGPERRILLTATEAYFHQLETSSVPATGTDADRYERTLRDAGFLRSVSDNFDLDATGALTPETDSPC